ncbi:RNA polymerase sigma-70 factor [Streptomyces sp. SID625]|nr:RNA polymerase sigma-70 factor [Streptomyces sp. SID625]
MTSPAREPRPDPRRHPERPAAAPDPATDAYVTHRNLLFTVAYEMLGSAADAEDVLQETWLRWSAVDLGAVREHRSYLVRIVTRQALKRLRTLQRRKESYVGPWLPEPLLTAPDVADDIELADSVSMAMLLVLETLGPAERAVFVLREVFALDYDEIAEAVGKTPAAVRQIAHRARSHVTARRPRATPSPDEAQRALRAFRSAVATGDLQSLVDVLAPDVVLLSDGGGIRQALPYPVVGIDNLLRLLTTGWSTHLAGRSAEPLHINAAPALLVRRDDEIEAVLSLHLTDGRITAIYNIRNPEKLRRVEREAGVGR